MCGIWNLGQSTAAQLSHYRCLYRVWQGIGRQEPAARIFHLSATALSDVIIFLFSFDAFRGPFSREGAESGVHEGRRMKKDRGFPDRRQR